MLSTTLLLPSGVAQSTSFRVIDSLRNHLLLARKDTNWVKLSMELGYAYVMKPGETTHDLDSALSFSRQAYALSRSLGYPKGQGLSYLIAAQASREKGNKQQGRQLAGRAAELLSRYGSVEDQAAMYIEQAAYYTISNEGLTKQIHLYEKAVPLLERSGNQRKLADALSYRGDLYQLQTHNVQALRDLRRALALYHAIGYTDLQEIYDLLGFVSSKMGDYEAGVEYGLLAMQTVEAAKDTIKLAKVYSRLGITYHELNQPEKGLVYFNKSLRIAQKQYRRSTIIVLATTISAILNSYQGKALKILPIEESLGHLQEVIRRRPADKNDIDCRLAVATCYVNFYSKLHHDYDQAQLYGNELEAMLRANLGQDYHSYIHGVLIPFYILSKQYEKARVLLARNEKLCEKARYSKKLAVNHLWWFKLDSALARYAPAIRHYQRYNDLNDSLINETTKQRTALFEVQYQTREKEHKIVGLRQQGTLREIKLQKAETIRNFIIAGAFMLGLLLLLSYNRYRLKQRSHQQLQERQEEINQKNTTLQLLLSEKEWLLKEIHHRVKNNLQIVMSLLNSQASYLSDEMALSAIQESQHRVQAMALIHQKLYQSEQVARVDMSAYVQEVVAYLRDFYDLPQPIRFKLDISGIELEVNQAVPLGLIINEAITNALKYAFPDGRPGTIAVAFRLVSPTTYDLTIADDGVGLPPDYDPERSRSLGMTLMQGFSQQLGGDLQLSHSVGLTICLRFSSESLNPEYTAKDTQIPLPT